MRICGRLLRPSTLAERRLLLRHFGTSAVRIPRSHNIFAVARRVERYLNKNDDVLFLKKLGSVGRRCLPLVTPDVDSPEPPIGADDAVAAE